VVLLLSVKFKNGDDISDSIGLLISILVRYPEVGSINFDPQAHELRLTFILATYGENDKINGIKQLIDDSVQIYHQWERIRPRVFEVECENSEHYIIVNVKRDIDTLSRDEISFLMELFHTHFSNSLVAENNEDFWEEDLLIQEEMIGHMLEGLKNIKLDKKLIAYRDEGKVLVFNK
jgi:hypothetical protein